MVSYRRSISWTEKARLDIKEIFKFYDQRNGNKRYSKKLKDCFKEAAKQASLFPLSGQGTEYPHVRYIVVMPYYSLFYHFNNQAITVLVLWDNRREPSRLTYTLRNLSPQYLCEPEVPYGKQHKPDSESGK